tara:strand:- start:202 stop:852 length:651 start_codon:yes stop_codon:yes gene_type:complete
MDNLGHLAYTLILCSFLVRDIFWLRTLSVTASLSFIAFSMSRGIYLQVYWNIAFITINASHIVWIIYENRGVKFTEDEQELFETVFRNFSPVEFLKLLRQGTWLHASAGDTLAVQGENLGRIMLVFHGLADVSIDEGKVAEVRDGEFIGEMSFLTEEEASATVTATEPTRYLAWNKQQLRKFLNRNPSLRFAMQGVLGVDVSKKLKEMDEHGAEDS